MWCIYLDQPLCILIKHYGSHLIHDDFRIDYRMHQREAPTVVFDNPLLMATGTLEHYHCDTAMEMNQSRNELLDLI